MKQRNQTEKKRIQNQNQSAIYNFREKHTCPLLLVYLSLYSPSSDSYLCRFILIIISPQTDTPKNLDSYDTQDCKRPNQCIERPHERNDIFNHRSTFTLCILLPRSINMLIWFFFISSLLGMDFDAEEFLHYTATLPNAVYKWIALVLQFFCFILIVCQEVHLIWFQTEMRYILRNSIITNSMVFKNGHLIVFFLLFYD